RLGGLVVLLVGLRLVVHLLGGVLLGRLGLVLAGPVLAGAVLAGLRLVGPGGRLELHTVLGDGVVGLGGGVVLAGRLRLRLGSHGFLRSAGSVLPAGAGGPSGTNGLGGDDRQDDQSRAGRQQRQPARGGVRLAVG